MMGRIEARNREYVGELREKDPEHADAIIRQHNIDAFLFVGGMLTAGSGKLAAMFVDGIMAYGGYKYTYGALTNNPQESEEGLRIMGNGLLLEIGAWGLQEFAIPLTSKIASTVYSKLETINGFKAFKPSNLGFKNKLNGAFIR